MSASDSLDSRPSRRRLAVLGSPIDHSLSPRLHTTAYNLLGVPFDYGRVELGSGQLAPWLESLDTTWQGLSLTMPLKREIIPFLDTASPLVDQLGVANTVVFDYTGGARRLHGYNTDVDGIVRTVASLQATQPHSATILGGGATAASALYAAHVLGAREFTVYLRDVAKADDLTSLASSLGAEITVRPLSDLRNPDVDRAPAQEFVVSTLPGGAADALTLTPASATSVLFDVAYEPWPSRIATAWAASSGIVFSGLDMLVEQAISQVRLFTGNDQSVSLNDESAVRGAMRAAVGLAPADVHAGGIR